MTEVQAALFQLQDLKYREFHAKLLPTVEKKTILGVRVPVLRRFAKEFFKSGTYPAFLRELPHDYYEENNLHAFLIEQMGDFDTCMKETQRFLPYIDNWATCDSLRPKVFPKHLPELLEKIKEWIVSEQPYTIRFGVEMLMCYYLEDAFLEEYPRLVSQIRSDHYYVNMMLAWYFATALAKQPDSIFPYIEERRLSYWVHNKTIQKACESNRITEEQKKWLKKLRQ